MFFMLQYNSCSHVHVYRFRGKLLNALLKAEDGKQNTEVQYTISKHMLVHRRRGTERKIDM